MAEKTGIQWCHHTWSPHRGCCKISPGCALCYAEALSRRNPAVLGEWGPDGNRVVNKDWRKPLSWDRAAAKAGERRRVFPSLCDWLEDRPELTPIRGRFLELIARTPNLDWLLLTKRPEHFVRLMLDVVETGAGIGRDVARLWLAGDPPANVWYGTSVENQECADSRVYHVLNTPAAIRWVSYEPALGRVDWTCCQHENETEFNALNGDHGVRRPLQGRSDARVSWIVVGGESSQGGKQARPFDLEWARSAVAQCKAAGVPVFVKQMGAKPVDGGSPVKFADSHGGDMSEWPDDLCVREMPTPAKEVTRAK